MIGHVIFTVQNQLLQLGDGLCPEWHLTGAHKVQQHAQRPQIDRLSGILPIGKQFRRCVRRRTTKSVQQLLGIVDLMSKAKVGQFDQLLRPVGK